MEGIIYAIESTLFTILVIILLVVCIATFAMPAILAFFLDINGYSKSIIYITTLTNIPWIFFCSFYGGKITGWLVFLVKKLLIGK